MECDGCTLCCTLLNIHWFDSLAGEDCSFCDVGVGCTIFDDVPEDCKNYSCLYNQAEKCSENIRPDKCGVIFEKVTDEIFIGTVDYRLQKLNNDAKGQIISLMNEGFSVVLLSLRRTPIVHNANGHDKEEVWSIIKKKIEGFNGTSLVHN